MSMALPAKIEDYVMKNPTRRGVQIMSLVVRALSEGSSPTGGVFYSPFFLASVANDCRGYFISR